MDNPAAVPPGRIRLIPYFRVIWGSKETVRGNWYLGLIGLHTKGYPRELWIYLSLRGFLRWSAGTLVVTYFVGAAALTWFFSRNPYNKITYTDLILPTRWSEIKSLRGQALIDDGLAKLKSKQYGAAFMVLNRGLQLEPSNISARMVVAEFFTATRYYPRAMQIYRAGLPYAAGQRRFLENAFRLAEYIEDYEAVLQFIDAAEKTLPSDDLANRRLLDGKRILANEHLGRHEQNLKLWETANPPSMRLNTAWARALSAAGRGNEAIAAIQRDPAKFGVLREPWELLLELARANKRPDAGRAATDALLALDPSRYQLHAIQIGYLVEIGEMDEARKAIDGYFFRFGYDENAVLILFKAVEGKGSAALLNHIWSISQVTGRTNPGTYIAYVQNLLRLGEAAQARSHFPLAQQLIESARYPADHWVEGTSLLLDAMQIGSPSSISLLEAFASRNNLPPQAYRVMVSNLLQAQQPEAARSIALLARSRYPTIRNLPEIAAQSTPTKQIDSVIAQNNPKPDIIPISEAQEELIALEAAVRAKDWTSALAKIGRLEKSPLAKELTEKLLYYRVTLHGYLSEQTELSWYMRRLLGERFDPSRLRALAAELGVNNQKNSAQTLLREVLRKHPDAKWASEQLRTLESAKN